MNTLFAPFRDVELATRPRLAPLATTAAVPFDAVRTADALELSFDLPGYAPADVELSVDRNVLTLSAERSRIVADDATVVVGERRQGPVRRQLRLSESLALSAAEARFDNGVLYVRVPISEAAQPHKVEISVGADTVLDSAAVEAAAEGEASAN